MCANLGDEVGWQIALVIDCVILTILNTYSNLLYSDKNDTTDGSESRRKTLRL